MDIPLEALEAGTDFMDPAINRLQFGCLVDHVLEVMSLPQSCSQEATCSSSHSSGFRSKPAKGGWFEAQA